MFSALSKRKIIILASFNLSSANAFFLVPPKNLSFGKGLTLYHTIRTLKRSLFENFVRKGENAGNQQFPLFSSTGRRPASLCHGQLSVVRASVRPSVRASVRALTFSLNIFFAETTYRILMKFHRNVPTMVLVRISWNNLIPSKTLVAMATKLKIFWNLWKSSCQKP